MNKDIFLRSKRNINPFKKIPVSPAVVWSKNWIGKTKNFPDENNIHYKFSLRVQDPVFIAYIHNSSTHTGTGDIADATTKFERKVLHVLWWMFNDLVCS